MLEAQPETGSEAKQLEALLVDARLRETRSRKRAVFYTVLPIIVGSVFLGVSLYKAWQLERRATGLRTAIEIQTKELQRMAEEAKSLEAKARKLEDQAAEAERTLALARTKLSEIEKGSVNPQQKAREALREISTKQVRLVDSAYVKYYAGSTDLSDLQNVINIHEDLLNNRLVSLVAIQSNGESLDKATYAPVEPSWHRVDIALIPVSLGLEITEAEARGGTKIFEATIYVEGKITRVAVLRVPG